MFNADAVWGNVEEEGRYCVQSHSVLCSSVSTPARTRRRVHEIALIYLLLGSIRAFNETRVRGWFLRTKKQKKNI